MTVLLHRRNGFGNIDANLNVYVMLQTYQDRVTIKEVPAMTNSSKPTDRIVVIEPSQIVDADLIRCNTSLRMVLDKKKGTYKLQVMHFFAHAFLLANLFIT